MSSTIPAVVFDCNIFLQAVLNPSGAARACKQLVDKGQIELFVSPYVLAEVAEVLSRPGVRRLTPALTFPRNSALSATRRTRPMSISRLSPEQSTS